MKTPKPFGSRYTVVRRHPTLDDCWEWSGWCTKKGYGMCQVNNRRIRAHFLGTNATNTADMVAKGRARGARGSAHACSKLTEGNIREIRETYAAGGVTQQTLAARFGVTHRTVGRIITRENWTYVE